MYRFQLLVMSSNKRINTETSFSAAQVTQGRHKRAEQRSMKPLTVSFCSGSHTQGMYDSKTNIDTCDNNNIIIIR